MIPIGRTLPRRVSRVFRFVGVLTVSTALFGQFRGGTDWSTKGGDAHHSSWVRTDPKISPASVTAPGFQLIWKVKLGNEPLTSPVLMNSYIGYRGFRSYAFVSGKNEDAFALDSDLGRIEWQKHFPAKSSGGSGNCPGGMTAALTRSVTAGFPAANAGRPGFMGGRGGPAKSGVGQPLEGAVTLAQVAANRPPTPPPAPAAPIQPGAAAPPAQRFGPTPSYLYGLTSDGSFHSMYVSNGAESGEAFPFLPANANVTDFSVVDGVAYATTANDCGGVADGVWAFDLASKAVVSWKGAVTGGELSFGPAGAYVTSQNKLLLLDQKTLAAGPSYEAEQAFSTAPVVFEYKNKVMVAAATKDGVIHLVDGSSPTSAAAKSATGEADPFVLSSWQNAGDTRWILASSAKSVTAWKLVDQNGGIALQKDWTLNDAANSSAPLIINGVLFVVKRGDHSHNAVLSAFDAVTGKSVWTSGDTIKSYVPKGGGLAAGGSSVYLGTEDGTLWAFGFPIEH